MADRLARQEELRRAWISDSSHELRTPLAVLRAEIEAMQDGVRPADAATVRVPAGCGFAMRCTGRAVAGLPSRRGAAARDGGLSAA